MKPRQKDELLEELKAGIVYSSKEIEKKHKQLVKKYPDISIRKVVAYGRVSTNYEEQESSLKTQHEMFAGWINNHQHQGYLLVEEIYEQKSATLATKRPKFIKMIEDAKAGKYNTLIFKDSKRFSRNAEDFLHIIEDLKQNDINVIFITENLDTSIEKDRSMLTILGMMAEKYSNDLHINLQNTLKIKFESELGRVPGDVYGYKRVKGDSSRAIIVPEQADNLRELFNRYVDGEGVSSIVEDWRARGIKTYRGNNVTITVLRRYIRNPLYKGELVMNKYVTKDVRHPRVLNDEENWIRRYRPDLQIIDTELWNKCNKIMDANMQTVLKNTNGKIGYKPNILTNRLFSKVVVCGECGRNFNRKISNHKDISKRYTYLICGYKKYSKKNNAVLEVCHNETAIRIDYLVDIVSQVINNILVQSDNFEEQVTKKVISIIKKRNNEVIDNNTEEKLKAAKNKLKRVAILFKDGLVDEDEYKQVRNEVKKLENKNKLKLAGQLNDEDVQRLVRKFIDNLQDIIKQNIVDEGGVEVKQFNKLFDKIVINENSIDILFRAFNGQVEKVDITSNIEDLHVFVPTVANEVTKCNIMVANGTWNKKVKRHSKASKCCDRTIEFIELDSNNIDGKKTNQLIVGKREMKIDVYLV